jgi:hypothetical protein
MDAFPFLCFAGERKIMDHFVVESAPFGCGFVTL